MTSYELFYAHVHPWTELYGPRERVSSCIDTPSGGAAPAVKNGAIAAARIPLSDSVSCCFPWRGYTGHRLNVTGVPLVLVRRILAAASLRGCSRAGSRDRRTLQLFCYRAAYCLLSCLFMICAGCLFLIVVLYFGTASNICCCVLEHCFFVSVSFVVQVDTTEYQQYSISKQR